MPLDKPLQTRTLEVEKGGHLLPATFFSSSSSLLSSLLSEESLSLALLAAGAAGAFWTEAGGGTALYAPTKKKKTNQHHDVQYNAGPLYNYTIFKHLGSGDQLLISSCCLQIRYIWWTVRAMDGKEGYVHGEELAVWERETDVSTS